MIDLNECKIGDYVTFLDNDNLQAACKEYYTGDNDYIKSALNLSGQTFRIRKVYDGWGIVLDGDNKNLYANIMVQDHWVFRPFMFASNDGNKKINENKDIQLIFGDMTYG